MLDQDGARLLADIRGEWDKAEGYIKLAEQVTFDVVTPAIAELRYAGRRLVDALNGIAEGKPEEEIRAFVEDAKFNCFRARHDAIDAAFSKIAIDLELFSAKLGYKAVLIAYPNFEAFLAKLDGARQQIALTRMNRGQRDRIYNDLADVNFPELVNDYKAIKRSEAIMRRVVAKDRIAFWVTAALAVAGFGLAFYFWRYPVAPAVDIPAAGSDDYSLASPLAALPA